jgi:hypothetical protein
MQLWHVVGRLVQPPPPVSHASEVQLTLWQAMLPVHITSHAQELLHVTPLQLFGPAQETSQRPAPHVTP